MQLKLCSFLLAPLVRLLAPSRVLAEHCDARLTFRALVAPWNKADKDFHNGRTKINYYFEISERDYLMVYGNESGEIFPQSPRQRIRSDSFYPREKYLGKE